MEALLDTLHGSSRVLQKLLHQLCGTYIVDQLLQRLFDRVGIVVGVGQVNERGQVLKTAAALLDLLKKTLQVHKRRRRGAQWAGTQVHYAKQQTFGELHRLLQVVVLQQLLLQQFVARLLDLLQVGTRHAHAYLELEKQRQLKELDQVLNVLQRLIRSEFLQDLRKVAQKARALTE